MKKLLATIITSTVISAAATAILIAFLITEPVLTDYQVFGGTVASILSFGLAVWGTYLAFWVIGNKEEALATVK